MSTTPGVGESTTQVAPAEAVTPVTSQPGIVAETSSANAGLLRTIETAMAQAPANKVDVGVASLAETTPDQLPTVTIPQDPSVETPEPAKLTQAETVTPQTPESTYFPYAAQAKKALEEAKARGASQSDIEGLELKLQQATTKEGLLMTGIALIQIDEEITEAQLRGASQEELSELTAKKAKAVKARETLYEESFKQIKAHVERNKERDPRTFEQAVDDFMLKEAREIMDAMQLGLTRATEAGDESEIEAAKLRLQAAEMHVGIIKKKKGRGLRSLLNSIILSAGATILGETFKVSKGEFTPQRGH